MADDYALLADISGLKVVRTYLFGQSFVHQNWQTPGRAYGVVADGNRLWVADRQGGVSVYQAGSPDRMNQSSLLRNFASDFAEDFMIKDDILYVADGPRRSQALPPVRGKPITPVEASRDRPCPPDSPLWFADRCCFIRGRDHFYE